MNETVFNETPKAGRLVILDMQAGWTLSNWLGDVPDMNWRLFKEGEIAKSVFTQTVKSLLRRGLIAEVKPGFMALTDSAKATKRTLTVTSHHNPHLATRDLEP